VCNNPAFLSDIRACTEEELLKVLTNGGQVNYNEIGDSKLFPLKVHFNKDSIANIFSLAHVNNIDGCRIVMDTSVDNAIFVHLQDKVTKFDQCDGGLYYCHVQDFNVDSNYIKTTVTPYSPDSVNNHISLLSTVDLNKKKFTKKEVARADAARSLQRCMRWPSDDKLKAYMRQNLILNCKLCSADVDRANYIYGKAECLLQGKMTAPPQSSNDSQQLPLPNTITKERRRIKLYIDNFFVNGNTFLHTKSKDVNYITINKLNSRRKNDIKKKLRRILGMYATRGFIVTDVFADGEFDNEDYQELFLPATLHICAKGEHVPIIERSVRTVKERARATCHDTPFLRLPRIMTVSLMETIERWLNAFPSSDSVPNDPGPATIVLGRPPPDFSNNMSPFGAYVMAFTGTENNMTARSVPSIALRESNEAGGQYFMSLNTGKRFHSKKWQVLPFNQDIINKVHSIAADENQPVMPDKVPIFEWAPGIDFPYDFDEIETDSENEAAEGGIDEDEIVDRIQDHLAVVSEDDQDETDEETSCADDGNVQQDNIIIHQEVVDDNIDHQDENSNDVIADEMTVTSSDFEYNLDHAYVDEESTSTHDQDDETELSSTDHLANDPNEFDEHEDTINIPHTENEPRRSKRKGAGTGIKRLVPNRNGKSYADIQSKQMMNVRNKEVKKKRNRKVANLLRAVTRVVFTQMSAKKGFKKHGQKAVSAIFKELKQLDIGAVEGRPVIEAIAHSTLTPKEKREALEAVNLIKEKRDGDIKGRTCADGSGQRRFLKEGEEYSSPTSALESILSTLAIDAMEERDTAIADVPGAYLHAEFPVGKKVLLKLRGEFVDIMCSVNPKYKKHVVYEKRRGKSGKKEKVLYLKVLRALYGCLESALLWYNLYSSTLQKLGFKINPYDRCVANKMVNGSQCTIVFYVDDNKVSHKDPQVVTDVIQEISKYFGQLTFSRGSKHNFLGMDIEIKDKKVYISMKDQIVEAISCCDDHVGDKASTPATKTLFDVDDSAIALNNKKADIFHSITAKLLYICKRARPDIEPAVSFLCTRVSCPNIDDWKKMVRVLNYLKKTIDDRRIFGATSLDTLWTWVDASYAVHPNMRGHTGGAMSLGHGLIHTKSSKQKINAKSSTEAELVGVSEYLPFHIWLTNFLEYQGYNFKNKILYQDNQSAMKMEVNGRNSCTGNSRHIDIRYFFVKDRVESGKINISYCPTELMLADFFTKAVQGSLFKLFRDAVMGYVPMADIIYDDAKMKERVENKAKEKNDQVVILDNNDEKEKTEIKNKNNFLNERGEIDIKSFNKNKNKKLKHDRTGVRNKKTETNEKSSDKRGDRTDVRNKKIETNEKSSDKRGDRTDVRNKKKETNEKSSRKKSSTHEETKTNERGTKENPRTNDSQENKAFSNKYTGRTYVDNTVPKMKKVTWSDVVKQKD